MWRTPGLLCLVLAGTAFAGLKSDVEFGTPMSPRALARSRLS